jgi:hypothetical protein
MQVHPDLLMVVASLRPQVEMLGLAGSKDEEADCATAHRLTLGPEDYQS